MKTEEVKFEINKEGHLVINIKYLIGKNEETKFVILKEHLTKLKGLLSGIAEKKKKSK